MLQPMVLSLSLEALVDRRTVQEVCQQAQLHKCGQAAKLQQSVQARLHRERKSVPHQSPPHHAAAPTHPSAPRCTMPPSCAFAPRIPPLVPIPVEQAQARLRDAKRAAGLDERNVHARPSPPGYPPILED